MYHLDDLVKLSANLSLSNYNSKFLIDHPAEILLSYSLLRWLTTEDDPEIIASSLTEILKHNADLLEYSLFILNVIGELQLTPYFITITFDSIDEDVYGTWLQKLLQFEQRKTLASNYTMNASYLLDAILDETLEYTSVCDPFCGSGNLIVGFLRNRFHSDLRLIRINDIMPTAVLLAFCRISSLLRVTPHKVEVLSSIQDGFSIDGIFDLILINPPYTRMHRIKDSTDKLLKRLQPKFNTIQNVTGIKSSAGHAGLHFWSLIQAEDLLSPSGMIVAVLPRAILNAVYSQALKVYLTFSYSNITLYQYLDQKAFSFLSELRELVLVMEKPYETFNSDRISFNYLNRLFHVIPHTKPTTDELRINWNWGKYFLPTDSLQLSNQIISEANLSNAKSLDLMINRGIELYGPDIFFFPSKLFQMKNDDTCSTLELIHEDLTFSISGSKFRKILRKPNLYQDCIIPTINEVVITLSEELSNEEVKFIEFVQPEALAAIRKFGSSWYMHPTMQIQSKQPIGQIFVIDKLDVASTPTLAYYTPVPYLCTKNFYIIHLPESPNKDLETKFLAAWLNSSLYFLLYLTHRREIGGSYGRMQIIDYDHHYLFPNLGKISDDDSVRTIIHSFEQLATQSLPDLTHQVWLQDKMSLDQLLIEYFGMNISVEHLHEVIQSLLKDHFGLY